MINKHVIFGIIFALILVGGVFAIKQTSEEPAVGADLRVFTSAQVGTDPQNGYILSTNGSISEWIANSGGGGSGLWSYTTATDVLSPIIASTSNTARITASSFHATSTATSSVFNDIDFTNASGTGMTLTTLWGNVVGNLTGNVTGNADTATALFANGANCSSGSAPLGVDASGASEGCFDVWTEAENTSAAYISDLTSFDTGDLTEGSNLYYTDERAEDAAGGMFTGNTETLITVTYNDVDSTVDFTVDNDLANYSNVTSGFLTGNETITLSGDITGSGATAITTAIGAGVIVEPDLDADVAAVDGDFLLYDSTGTNFTWRSDSEVRSDLSLVVGTNVQAWDADLDTYAGITPSANVQSLLGAANYAAMRTLLDLEAGTDFYSIAATDSAIDTDVATHAALTATHGATGAIVGTTNTQTLTNKTLTSPTIGTNFTFDSVTVTALSGADTTVITGTAGSSGNCAEWDANGDLVDAGAECGTGAGGGGGTLSTTTEKVGAGATSTVSYVTDEFMLGGSASTSAEFLFDYASSSMEIRGTGTTTILSTGNEEAVIIGEGDQNTDDGWDVGEAIEFDFGTAGDVIVRGLGTVAEWVSALNYTFTGIINFTSATVNFGAGAIDAITEIASGLKSGLDATLITGTAGTNGNLGQWNADGDLVDSSLATADVVTGASTDTFTNKTFDANGTGNSISNIDLTADVINTLPVGNGGTGITSLGTGIATWWGTPSSANFLSALTDTLDLGSETSFEIPNGTGNTVNVDGQIAHDTTDDQLIIGADAKVIRTEEKIFAFTLASTSQEFVSGGEIPVPLEKDGYTVTNIKCYVQGGTSVQMTLTDNTNAMDTLTCATTATTDDGTIANASVTADELMYVDVGTITGTPDYVTYSVFGTWTRE